MCLNIWRYMFVINLNWLFNNYVKILEVEQVSYISIAFVEGFKKKIENLCKKVLKKEEENGNLEISNWRSTVMTPSLIF